MGTGPFFNDIGGKGMALTILALTFTAFFNWDKVIVEINLMIFWTDLNFNSLIIFSTTVGVTPKNTQSHLSTICCLFYHLVTFLTFFFSFFPIELPKWGVSFNCY